MDIIPFSLDAHYDVLRRCLSAWHAYPTPKSEIPATGFVALYDGYPAAFAFIRLVEGGFGQLDGLTSNRLLPGDIRDQAIDAIVSHLISHAKTMKLKNLTAFSKDENTLKRSVKHGFSPVPLSMIALGLNGEGA